MTFNKKDIQLGPYPSIAHAKINLALHVTGQREDSYHLLDSLVCFTDFGDRLTIEPASEATSQVSLNICGPFASDLDADKVQVLGNNLVTRAAMALAEAYGKSGFRCPNVRIILEKNLPVASGIGGGSADAATVLLMLQEFWQKEFTPGLHSIAAKLGADVPMCLNNHPKRVRGTGELISEYNLPVSMPILLVNPQISLSTPQVFAAMPDKNNSPIPNHQDMMKGYSEPTRNIDDNALIENAVEMLSPLRNDLQNPAISLVPEIHDVLVAIEQQPGCILARMSGSGATSFGIFSNQVQASNALTRIKESNPQWWSVACRTIATIA